MTERYARYLLISLVTANGVYRQYAPKRMRRREGRNNIRVTGLLHDGIDNGNGQASKHGRERAHANVWDVGIGVAVADTLEFERAIEANEPASKTEEELRQRWVHVEVVLSLDIVCGELSKVNLIKSMAA